MRIALIGDIHLYSLRPTLRQLLGKRLLGQGNLWLNRQFRYNPDMLGLVIERAEALQPDMVMLTGDVTSTGLGDEFRDIVEHLSPLSQRVELVLVPGNHDRYTFRGTRRQRLERRLEGLLPAAFPHHQKLTEAWDLVALDSARPQVMMSRGALGSPQLAATERILGDLPEDRGLVVLCHYPAMVPPGTPRSWAHDLAEADELRELLQRRTGRTLFLHGHIHRPWHWDSSRGGGGEKVCVNAGAPCITSSHYPLGQGFWQIDLPREADQPVKLIHHIPTPHGHYGTHGRRHLQHRPSTWHARQVV